VCQEKKLSMGTEADRRVAASVEVEERERIGQVVGALGGKPRLKGKILNGAFVAAVLCAFSMPLLTKGFSQIVFIDVGILLLSLKFAYHLHTEAKVNHAQFWILTTIEDRLLNVIGELRAMRRECPGFSESKQGNSPAETSARREGNPQGED
jgi:hypothetical protein